MKLSFNWPIFISILLFFFLFLIILILFKFLLGSLLFKVNRVTGLIALIICAFISYKFYNYIK